MTELPENALFAWSADKNSFLIETRGVSFDEVVSAINAHMVKEVVDHPNQEKYPNQKIAYVLIGGYIHYVPFIQNENVIFLKTIIPSRKANKLYN